MSCFRNLLMGAVLALTTIPTPAHPSPHYFKSVDGTWKGGGSVVAGKYKGTRFNCRLNGEETRGKELAIKGSCRIGLFTQKISARLSRKGRTYQGTFLDGAKGEGMDITSGRVGGNKLTVAINSKGLTGAIVANLVSRNKLRVSVSVRVSSGRYVPVVGLDLTKARR